MSTLIISFLILIFLISFFYEKNQRNKYMVVSNYKKEREEQSNESNPYYLSDIYTKNKSFF